MHLSFVANFLRFSAVQKVWKSFKIRQSDGQLKGGNFFETQCRSTQPCIPPGSLNRVPALAGVKAGLSPLPGAR